MKTKNAVLTVAAVILASAFTFAANPSSKLAVVSQNNSGIFKVIYEGASAGKVTLRVYDASNNLLVSETTKGINKFMRPLNFTSLDRANMLLKLLMNSELNPKR